MTNQKVIPFERKSAQNSQPSFQQFLHSVFFIASVITEFLPKFIPENCNERDFILSHCDRHLSVIRNFTAQ